MNARKWGDKMVVQIRGVWTTPKAFLWGIAKACALPITLLLILLFSAMSAHSAPINLAWDANTESDIAGYRMYRASPAGGPYVQIGEIAHPTTTFTDPDAPTSPAQYYVTAFDQGGSESGPSNVLLVDLPPVPPANLVYTVQTSSLDYLRDPRIRRWLRNRGVEAIAADFGRGTFTARYPSKTVATDAWRYLKLHGYEPRVIG